MVVGGADMTTIKRCPYCGWNRIMLISQIETTEIDGEEIKRHKSYKMKCEDCLAETCWENSKANAIRTWNQRADNA